MWASLTLPKWARSCSNRHPALVTLKAQLEGHPGVQNLDPLDTFSPPPCQKQEPSQTLTELGHFTSQAWSKCGCAGCPEKPCVCFVHIWLILPDWVNKVLSALAKHHGVKETALLKNLSSPIPKTDHCFSLSRVWLVFICAIKLLHLWLHPKSH